MTYKGLLSICVCILLHFHCDGQYNVKIIVQDFCPVPRESVYIAGSFNNWDSLSNPQYKLVHAPDGTHSITLKLSAGRHEFKFTGGNWLSVEKTYIGQETGNRSFTIDSDTSFKMQVYQWRDKLIPGSRLMLQQAKDDTIRLKALTLLANAYSSDPVSHNIDSSLYYCQTGMQLINRLIASGKGKEWNQFNLWAPTLQLIYTNLLGSLGNYVKSLEVRLDVLRFQEINKDTLEIISTLLQIANEYLHVNDYNNALTSSNRAQLLLSTVHDYDHNYHKYLEIQTHLHLATTYFRQNELDKSFSNAKSALDNARQIYDYYALSSITQLIGDLYLKKHQLDSANHYYREAIANSITSHNYKNASLTYKGMSMIFREQQQIDSALHFAKLSLDLIRNNITQFQASGEYGESYIAEISPIIADLYRRKNQMDSAYHYLQLSVTLKDSLFSSQRIREFQNLTFNESSRKSKEAQQILDERQRASTRLKMYGFTTGLLALSFLAFFQYRNSRQKHKTNLLLSSQKKDLENTLTVLQQTQKQLIQSEKMASLGELTAGIAHEIQNPLNFVNNFSEVNSELIEELKVELQNGNTNEAISLASAIGDNEQKINNHGKRADAIVKGMLQHSRSSNGVKEPTDINALADEYLRLAYHGLRAKDKTFNATMKTDFDNSIGKIDIIPQDIGRVMLNLITNAFYAVSTAAPKSPNTSTPLNNRGDLHFEPTVTISTKLLHSPPGDLGASGRAVDSGANRVEISVSDNGPGIPNDILDKIFQPFFTTKPTGQGTGLGLSLSYDIVKAHGGELTVETKEGEGTKFIIQLPITKSA